MSACLFQYGKGHIIGSVVNWLVISGNGREELLVQFCMGSGVIQSQMVTVKRSVLTLMQTLHGTIISATELINSHCVRE